MDYTELVQKALDMRAYSYTPYSHFNVGAALLTKSGKVYTGCNIENAAFSATNCAERTAIFKAVSEGERDFAAIAVVGGPAELDGKGELPLCPPCAICRQVMREFCTPGFEIVLGTAPGRYEMHTLEELLPLSFGPENLA